MAYHTYTLGVFAIALGVFTIASATLRRTGRDPWRFQWRRCREPCGGGTILGGVQNAPTPAGVTACDEGDRKDNGHDRGDTKWQHHPQGSRTRTSLEGGRRCPDAMSRLRVLTPERIRDESVRVVPVSILLIPFAVGVRANRDEVP
jgi:hypothetical protein